MPRKVMLKIVDHKRIIIHRDYLLDALPSGIIPKSEWSDDGYMGCIERIQTKKANLPIFVYVFGKTTQCSKANNNNLSGVGYEEKEDTSDRISHPSLMNKNVAWSFFTLNSDPGAHHEYFQDENCQILKIPCYFPSSYEYERVESLKESILQHYGNKVSVKLGDPKSQTKRYCEFTGGSNLLIKGKESHVVISSDVTLNEGDPSWFTCEASRTVSFECKSSDHGPKVEFQLFANMVTALVTQLVKNLTNFTDRQIEALTSIEGYGIIYTGHGEVGLFTMKMKFNESTQIFTKLKIRRYPSIPSSYTCRCLVRLLYQ